MSSVKQRFKVGDKVKCIAPTGGLVECGIYTVSGLRGHNRVELSECRGGFGYFNDRFKLVPTYPNLPHKHAEVIKAWADGAEVQILVDSKVGWISYDPDTLCTDLGFFTSGYEYRVEPAKTEKEIQIEKLEQQAKDLAKEIAKLKGS